jgi:O-antigen/teichoic acid export membrane protein
VLSVLRQPQVALAGTHALCEGSAFLRNLILARLIGPDEMGLAVMLALGIRVIEMVGDLGLERLVVQVEGSALHSMRRTVHLLQLVKGSGVALLAALVAVPLTRALNPELEPSVFVLAAMALAIRGAVNCDYRERQRDRNFKPALVVEGGSNFLAALAIAPIALITRDYTALVWASLLQAAMLCALSHLLAARPIAFGLDSRTIRRCLRYGVPVAFNGALMFIALQGDRLIVALHFPAADLARFAIAAQLALVPALVGARFLLAWELPRFARLVDDPSAARAHLWRQLRGASAAASFGGCALGLLGNAIIGVLYGSDYLVAPAILWLLAAAAGLRLIRAVPATLLMALERTNAVLLSNVPRVLAAPAALWAAAAGSSLETVVGIGVIGEALSLLLILHVAAVTRTNVAHVRRAAEAM